MPDLDQRLRDVLSSVDGDWEPTTARRVRILAAVHHVQRRRRQTLLAVASAAVIAAAALTGVALAGGDTPTVTRASGAHGSPARAPSAPSAASAASPQCVMVQIGSAPARCAGTVAPFEFGTDNTSNAQASTEAPLATGSPASIKAAAMITARVGQRVRVTLPSATGPHLAWTVPASTPSGLTRTHARGPSGSGSTSATFVARRPGTWVIAASELERCESRSGVCGGPFATYALHMEVPA